MVNKFSQDLYFLISIPFNSMKILRSDIKNIGIPCRIVILYQREDTKTVMLRKLFKWELSKERGL
jgi:hypothetical protein